MDTTLGRVIETLSGLGWTARADRQIDLVSDRWSDHTGLGAAAGWRAGTA